MPVTAFNGGAAASPISAKINVPLPGAAIQLRDHLRAQIDGCLLRNPAGADRALFTVRNGTTFTRNPAFVCAALSGLSALCPWVIVGGTPSGTFVGITAISPDIVTTANHAIPVAAGDTVYFVSEDGADTVVTRTITGSAVRVGTTDIALLKLSSALPATIRPLKLATPATWHADKLEVSNATGLAASRLNALPLFATNRSMQLIAQKFPASNTFNEADFEFWSQAGAGDPYTAIAGAAVSGDSGHALALAVRGELLLHSHFISPSGGPGYGYHKAAIDTAIAGMGGTATTGFSLSGFPAAS